MDPFSKGKRDLTGQEGLKWSSFRACHPRSGAILFFSVLFRVHQMSFMRELGGLCYHSKHPHVCVVAAGKRCLESWITESLCAGLQAPRRPGFLTLSYTWKLWDLGSYISVVPQLRGVQINLRATRSMRYDLQFALTKPMLPDRDILPYNRRLNPFISDLL